MKILAVGEVMLELAQVDGAGADIRRLGIAGDTYNTAVYLARLGISTGYMSRLGDDAFSHGILNAMASEAIDSALVEVVPGRVPGLYMIANSDTGERVFTYWRGQSPAREMLASTLALDCFEAALQNYAWVYFSGITLAILDEDARDRLYRALARFRARGGRVAFDSNYRPRLWRDIEEVREAMNQALHVTDVALLTDEDERALWGDDSDEPTQARCARAKVAEVVIKRGPNPVKIATGELNADGYYGQQFEVPVPAVTEVVDTTAAGDSFNAGYLAERLRGGTIEAAVARGAKCAVIVIAHKGAIVDKGLVTQATTT